MNSLRRLLFLFALSLLPLGCRTTSDLETMYRASLQQSEQYEGKGGLTPNYAQDQDDRLRRVQLMDLKGELKTPLEQFYASVILVRSDAVEHLEMAERLALLAGRTGEPRALPVAAEAIDRRLLKERRPQRYGTQYVYEAVLEKWLLYPTDPETTDEDRAELGIPPLAVLQERERQLNELASLQILGSKRSQEAAAEAPSE